MSVNQKLAYLRKKNGLSQLKLAETLHVSRQDISRWETGAAMPSTDNLRSLSDENSPATQSNNLSDSIYDIPNDVLSNIVTNSLTISEALNVKEYMAQLPSSHAATSKYFSLQITKQPAGTHICWSIAITSIANYILVHGPLQVTIAEIAIL